MWSLENHCHERGRVFERNRPSFLREFSNSPPRNSGAPLHESRDEPASNTHKASLVPLVTLTTAPENGSAPVTSENPHGVEPDVLELWKAFQETIQNEGYQTAPITVNPAPASKHTAMIVTEVANEHNSLRGTRDMSCHGIERNLDTDRAELNAFAPVPTSSRFPSTSRTKIYPGRIRKPAGSDPTKSMHSNAKNTSVQFLQNLLNSSKLNIIGQQAGEVYVRSVSLCMLEYFCNRKTIAALLHNNTIAVPPACASKDGIIRVVRYMRRWCQNASFRPNGGLRTPPSIKEGIATSLACRFFCLHVDAQHMQDLVIKDLMGNPQFFITDEDVELIWSGYEGALKYTPFGDAVVWFILDCVMAGTHALADEIRWLLEQEGYEDLKMRIRYELKTAEWRKMGRMLFLQRCSEGRERRVVTDEAESSKADRRLGRSPGEGNFVTDKPLPHLPVSR